MDTRNCTRAISGGFGPWACRICGPLAWGRIRSGIGSGYATIATWRQRQRYRAYLATMGERDLRDIGLCRTDAEREANLPFWKHPAIDETSRGRAPRI